MQSGLKVSNWLWVDADTCGRVFQNSSHYDFFLGGGFYYPFCYQGEPAGLAATRGPSGAH